MATHCHCHCHSGSIRVSTCLVLRMKAYLHLHALIYLITFDASYMISMFLWVVVILYSPAPNQGHGFLVTRCESFVLKRVGETSPRVPAASPF